MRKVISTVNENRVTLPVKVPNLRDSYEKHIVLTVTDTEGSFEKMLEHIRHLAAMGHSFVVDIDPNNSDYNQKFYIDGDGMDKIIDITVHKYRE